jgi:hypothetical protein
MTSNAGDGREFPVALATDDGTVVVNFGLLTGREATQAELDQLARSLAQAGAGPELTLTAARRQDYAPGIEAVSYQVHVVSAGISPAVVESLCEEWAERCAEDRSIEPLE